MLERSARGRTTPVHFLPQVLPGANQASRLAQRHCLAEMTKGLCQHLLITEGFKVVKHFPRLKDYSGLEIEIWSSCSNEPDNSPEPVRVVLS